jgi:hypothetical protein
MISAKPTAVSAAEAFLGIPTPALSRVRAVLSFDRMANLTLEATIDHGRITVTEPEKLPVTGKALLTVLDSPGHKPDWNKIQSILGTLKTDVDAAEWERQIRSEWDERERAQWGKR